MVNVVYSEALRNRIVDSTALSRYIQRIEDSYGQYNPTINVTHVEWFGNRPGFIMVNTHIEKEGVRLPGAAMLRGDGVGILLVLHVTSDSEGERTDDSYTVLVRQDRTPIGGVDYAEIPAGTLDKPGLGFNEIAALEIREEVDETIDTDNARFIELGKFHTSPGGLDEQVSLVALEIETTIDYVLSLNDRITGADDGEVIRLEVINLDDLPSKTTDMKTTLAYHLYKAQR